MDALEKTMGVGMEYASRRVGLLYDPGWDQLRDDPRFQALLKVAPLFVVNTAAGTSEAVQARLRDILAGRL